MSFHREDLLEYFNFQRVKYHLLLPLSSIFLYLVDPVEELSNKVKSCINITIFSSFFSIQQNKIYHSLEMHLTAVSLAMRQTESLGFTTLGCGICIFICVLNSHELM